MPQDSPRRSQSTERVRDENARSETVQSDTSPAVAAAPEAAARRVAAGLRTQNELFDVLSDVGRYWFARAGTEAEFALNLPNRLSAARSIPDFAGACQQWFGEWMNLFGEDSRRVMDDSRRLIDAGARCFAGMSPAVTS